MKRYLVSVGILAVLIAAAYWIGSRGIDARIIEGPQVAEQRPGETGSAGAGAAVELALEEALHLYETNNFAAARESYMTPVQVNRAKALVRECLRTAYKVC